MAKASIAEAAWPAQPGSCCKSLESFVGRLYNARRGIGIVSGNKLPDQPKLILNARSRMYSCIHHARESRSSVCGADEEISRPQCLCLGPVDQCSVEAVLPIPEGCLGQP